MPKLVFLIRSLDAGGAERQVVTLAKALDARGFEVAIFQFYAGGALESELNESRVRLVNLDKGGRWDTLRFWNRLVRRLRRARPDIVHGYLDISNLLVVALKPWFRRTKMVWGIRSAEMHMERYGWSWKLPFQAQCRLARFADLIIANSQAARDHHIACGFPPTKVIVIPNGFDTSRFQPDPRARARLRSEWQVGHDTVLIGLVARLDPIKDHATFLRAAVLLREKMSADGREVRFVCVGGGPSEYARQMHGLAVELGLGEHIIWAGPRADMPDVYNALDIATNCSDGESFPNTVGEAMACGVPCVVTKVGDSAWMVGDTGLVVPPRDPHALATGWLEMAARDRTKLGVLARSRVLEMLSVQRLAERSENVLRKLLEAR